MKEKFIIIETTCPNLQNAKKLSLEILTQNLAACVHFVEIKSSYLWNKKIVGEKEILVRIKSKKSLFFDLEKTIKNLHSYEIPQIIVLDIKQGSKSYLNWLESNLKKTK